MARYKFFDVTVGEKVREHVRRRFKVNRVEIIGGEPTNGSTTWTFTVASGIHTVESLKQLVWDMGVPSVEVQETP